MADTTKATTLQAGDALQRRGARIDLQAVLLVALPVLLYLPSLGFGLLGYDDDIYYLHNPALHLDGLAGLGAVWKQPFYSDYMPLTQLTLWLDVKLFGAEHWWGARLHGLLWFGAGTLALRALVARVTGRPGVAFAAALLYALHPVCAPSVLWLAERKNLVCFALTLWSAERYAKAREHNDVALGAVAFVLCGAALLAKVQALVLPGILAVYEVLLRGDRWTRSLKWWAPFALLCGSFLALNLLYVRDDAAHVVAGGSRAAAVATDGPILLHYVWNTVCPLKLAFFYMVRELQTSSAIGWTAWAGFLAVSALLFWLSQERGHFAFFWLVGLGALAPTLNFFPQTFTMADHYLHWALCGWIPALVLLADGGLALAARHFAFDARRSMLAAFALGFAVLTFLRIDPYRSMETLMEHNIAAQPQSANAWSRYAVLLHERPHEPGDQMLTDACENALNAPDAARLQVPIRAMHVKDLSEGLYRKGDLVALRQMVERERAYFTGPWAPLGVMVQAWVDARAGSPREALLALGSRFDGVYRSAAATLRARCRPGQVLPDALPPEVTLPLPPGDAYTRNLARQVPLEILEILATAHRNAGDAEASFDVAAVLVNMAPDYPPGRQALAAAYRALGLPDAASRLLNVSEEK